MTPATDSTVVTEDNVCVHVYENPVTGSLVVDQGSQTAFSKYILSAKVDTRRLKNKVALKRPHYQAPKIGILMMSKSSKKNGIMRYLKPNDLVLADRGFTMRELLNPVQGELKISPFLKGRKSLSVAEKLETRRIAKARIHVERFNRRLKEFKLIDRKIPLILAPLLAPPRC
ncbi:hypothetical protein AWC38_SpisGene12053 [Stylophora pistillata]|uniref:DDE Tnp4 domain-containing protein n=1 Tax=Stylophora pistillata TaxID=50429 RepID=A0A2B4S4F4_STYPI|nr:hypothetical protein AWC38_SpisGene12053 [Stylophora pistillata]